MVKSELSIIINAPPEKVFARISDPMTMVEDAPSVVEVKDIEGEGVGGSFHMVYKMLGMPFEVEVTCTEAVPNGRIGVQYSGAIRATSTTSLEPHDGGTKLNVVIEYTIPVPLVGKIAEALLKRQNEREWELMLANLKARVEAEA